MAKVMNVLAAIIAILDIIAMFILANLGYTTPKILYYTLYMMIFISLIINALKTKESLSVKKQVMKRTLINVVIAVFFIILVITATFI